MEIHHATEKKQRTAKLAIQPLNNALCFASRWVVADSLELRNRQLLIAA
jgi:hypothetical protein